MLGIEICATYANRMDIRADFGSHNRWGIDRSGEDHVIILVSDPARRGIHRYRDALLADGRFRFYGQRPQNGDPNDNNNHMVRDHMANGDSLELFIREGEAYVYRGEWLLDEEQHLDGGQVVFILRRQQEPGHPVFERAVEDYRNAPNLRDLAYQAADDNPARRPRAMTVFRRSAIIVAHALNRAENVCERCDERAPFQKPNNSHYLEVHHIGSLSDGGPDHPLNVAAVCPNCHRELHYGRDTAGKNRDLREIVLRKEAHRAI